MTKAQSDGALSSTQPSFSPSATLRIFITVGSTRFDALIASTVLGKSFLQAVSGAIPDGGRLHCIAQYGNSDIPTILASSSLLEQGDSESSKSSSLGKFNFSLKPSQPSDGVVTPFRSGDTLEATQKSAEGAGQVDLSLFGFASDLRRYIEAADIVISHAGSGTMLEVLRLPPLATGRQRQLLVVPNTSLMDNHQMELAESLASALPQAGQAMKTVQGPFCHVATVEDIAEKTATVIADLLAGKTPLKQFPAFDGSSFRHLVDEEMGFI